MNVKILSRFLFAFILLPLLFSCAKVNYDGRPVRLFQNPTPQGFQLTQNNFIMTEGEVREFQLEFTNALQNDTNFNWTIVSKNKAINPTDRFKTPTGTTTGKGGQKNVTVRIAAVDINNIQEGTQEFFIMLTPQGSQEPLPSNLTLLDARKLPRLRFQQDTISIQQTDLKGEHVLELDETSQLPVVIDIETQDAVKGTPRYARYNDRYKPFKTQMVIPPGSKTIPVPIELVEQYVCRAEGEFYVVVTQLKGASMDSRRAKVIILEDQALCNPPPPPPPPPIDIVKNQRFVMSEGERRVFGVEFINVYYDTNFSWRLEPVVSSIVLTERFKTFTGYTSIRAGHRVAPIDISAVDIDNIRQGDQEYVIHIVPEGTTVDFTAGLTLIDKFKQPGLRYHRNPITIVNRADGLARIVMNETSTLPVTIDIDTQDGDAYANVDYRPLTANKVVIPPGALHVDIPLNLIPQTECKRELHFYIAASNITNATMMQPRAKVLIPMDQELCRPLPAVRYERQHITIRQGTSGRARLLLNETARKDVVIDIESKDLSAVAGTDYTAVKTQVTIPRGSDSVDVPLSAMTQTECKREMNFELNVTNLTNATMSDRRAVVTIPRDPELCRPLPVVRYADSSITIRQGQAGMATLVLNENARKDVVIDIETQDVSAVAGTDYTAVKTQLTIPTGSNSVDLPLRVLAQTVCKQEMTFSVVVTNLTNATMPDRRANVTIPKDRELCKAPPVLRYHRDVITIRQGQNGTATLVLNEPSRLPVLIEIETQNGSALADVDYVPVKIQLEIPPGVTSIDVPIHLLPQTVCKEELQFYLVVTKLTNATMNNRRAVIIIPKDRELCKKPEPPPIIPQPIRGEIRF